MSPYSRIFATSPNTHQLRTTMEPVEVDDVVLTPEDVHGRMQRWFPHLHYVTEYLVHQVEDDLFMHVAFQAKQKRAKLVVIAGLTDIVSQRVFKDVVSIQGFKDRTLYMWSRVNQLIKAELQPHHPGHRRIFDLRSILGPVSFPTFFLESGPYRAIHNDRQLRIAELDFHMSDRSGFLVADFQKHLPFLEKSSIVHIERIIVFVSEEERSIRKINDRLVCVTSPLFACMYEDFPILHLSLAQDKNDFIYLFIPACKTLAIIDPENLRFSETKLLFGADWEVDTNAMTNLISVADGIVKIGIPTLAIDPSSRFRQIVGYNKWTGAMPPHLKWHCSSQLSTEGSECNDGKLAKSQESGSSQTPSVDIVKSEARADKDTQTEGGELDLLRAENEQLKNSLNRQKEIMEKLRKRNAEMATENRKLATEYEAKINKLKIELRQLKNKERGEATGRLDDELDSSEKSEDPSDWDDVDMTNANIEDDLCSMEATARKFEQIRLGDLSEAKNDAISDRRPTPIGSERKRRVNIAMRNKNSPLGSLMAVPTTSQPAESSILTPLDRSTTPFGILFSGQNFTSWSEDGSGKSGREELRKRTQ